MRQMHFLSGACCAVAIMIIMSFTTGTAGTSEYKLVQPGTDLEKTLNTWAGLGTYPVELTMDGERLKSERVIVRP